MDPARLGIFTADRENHRVTSTRSGVVGQPQRSLQSNLPMEGQLCSKQLGIEQDTGGMSPSFLLLSCPIVL